MSFTYIFSDESGCFTFNRKPNVSRYFMVTTVVLDDCAIGAKLQDLRRDMIFRDIDVDECFHATTDAQAVRNEVFALLQNEDFRIDTTILEKSKAQPQTRRDKPTFYQYAWYYHFKNLGPRAFNPDNKMLVTAAALGTKKEKGAYKAAVHDVAQQILPTGTWKVDFPKSQAEPCLQVADYCSWAIQRKWERNDDRSYILIADKIKSEYDLWSRGTHHYY